MIDGGRDSQLPNPRRAVVRIPRDRHGPCESREALYIFMLRAVASDMDYLAIGSPVVRIHERKERVVLIAIRISVRILNVRVPRFALMNITSHGSAVQPSCMLFESRTHTCEVWRQKITQRSLTPVFHLIKFLQNGLRIRV